MSITVDERTVALGEMSLRVRTAGPANSVPIVFLHGWPEDSHAWDPLIAIAASDHHCIAVDLPGIGGSSVPEPNGDKGYCAGVVHELIERLALRNPVLVGHDVGGMIAFAYLRRFRDLRAVVIMDTVIPGIAPWTQVLANPYLWHFAFHSIPDLPERLVRGNEGAYFDYFYDAISARPGAIPRSRREAYVRSYLRPGALDQGFEFYRAFAGDARQNAAEAAPIDVPTLYIRGEREGGVMADYDAGLRAAGLRALMTALIPDVGHFTAEEAPEATWLTIRGFVESLG